GSVACCSRAGAAKRGGATRRSRQVAASRRNDTPRSTRGALSPQVAFRQGLDMRPASTLLVWLALAAGLLQAVICAVLLFQSGWAAAIVLLMMLLPFVPLILTREFQPWRRLDPVIPAIAAVISMAVSGGFYWMVFTQLD